MARQFVRSLLMACSLASLATADDSLKKSVAPLVQSSCIDCHDADTDTRLNFENLSGDLTDPAVFRQWEQVFDRVTTGKMPPKSEPRPDSTQVTDALAKLKDSLKAENLAQQQAIGRVPSRRLTRLEYAYTVRDLLEIDEGGFADDLAEMLPPESDSGGFDTVAATQRTSPLHIESWLRAADHALNTAIKLGPRPESTRRVVDFPNAPYLSTFNKRSLTNGGSNLKQLDDAVAMFLDLDYVLRSDHCGLSIETAGYYRITLDAYAYQADRPMTLKLIQANPKKVGPDLLGAFDLQLGQPRTIEVTTFMRPGDFLYPTTHVANGNTWSELSAVGGADNYKGEGIAVKSVFVEGPLVDHWPPASTQVLLSERASSESPLERVTDVVTRIAPRAFRRSLHANELESFVNLARPGVDEGREFAEVIRAPIRSVLSSPQFLFFGGEPGKLDDFALASRLSYFLWKSLPDEELFELARKGQLSDGRVLAQQVERMLDDPKSIRFVRDFVGQWLRLYDINATTPDRKLYPEFDGLLSDSISKETELFFAELIHENLSAANLIDSDFTFANRRLAEHYRLPKVQGQEMRKVSLPQGSVRGGILGQASILKLTSNGTFTSPVIGHVAKQAGYRSIWVGKTHVTTGSSYTKFAFDEGVFTPGEPDVRGTSPYDHFKNVKNNEFWNSDSFLWWPEVQVANHPSHPDKPFSWQETKISDYGPDIEMERIFDFMERSKAQDKPFFVYHTSHLGHQAVDMASPRHNMTWPGTPKLTWNAESKTYTRQEPKITPRGPVNTLSTTYEKENITPDELKYQIEYLDYQMWQYINKLKAMGELENTIVIFTSDNATKGWKASVEKQRGVHVPFVVYAPGQSQFVQGRQDIVSDLSDLLPTLADIMGTKLPPQDEYELNGTSLWPYLTKQSDKHREWIYGFKGNRQMVRGHHLLRDGKGAWWDASETPANMDSFPPITDLTSLSADQQKEKVMIDDVLKRFARSDIGGPHSFHADPSRKLTEQEIEKMRLKRQRLEEHLEQFE